MAVTRKRAGPKLVSIGPTSPGCIKENTASPASSKVGFSTIPKSTSVKVRPRSDTALSKVSVPATISSIATCALERSENIKRSTMREGA